MFAASKSGLAAPSSDPSFRYVALLLDTTTTNGQQNNTFLDSSTNNFTITRNGTPTQGSVTPYWPNGQWSNYFGGTGNYASVSSTPITSTTSTFTIEGWIFPTSAFVGTIPSLIGDMTATGVTDYFSFGPTSANTLQILWFDGVVKTCTGNTTISLNVWTHIAVSVNANAISLYVNGVQQTLSGTTTLTNRSGTTGGFVIAQINSATNYYTGYISNLSVLNGTAKYSAGFTPSTTPLSVSTTNQTLLTCYSNRFIDSNTATTAKTITVTGTPRVQAFQPFSPTASYTAAAYGGSGYFNGSSDYLSIADNAALQLGTGDFTIEGWFYISGATSTAYNLISKGAAATGWSLNTTTGARIQFSYTASNLTGATTTLVQNAWYHIAVVRSGSASGNLKIYLNGVQEIASAGAVNDDFSQTSTMYISASRTATVPLNGYSSNIRIVKGTAVYTAAFTPPTAPVTAITNTSLLLNYTNAGIYDAAVQNNAITVGDAQASITVSRWSPTSMKFDGTGDWLTAIDGPQLNIGSGDFTIECWVNRTATASGAGNGDTIVSKGTNNIILSINVNTSKFEFAQYGVAILLTSTTVISNSTWYYVAITRSGTSLRMFVNGTQEASTTNSANLTSTTSMFIGADANNTNQRLNGYIQDLRITKGIARTITTPTAAFPTR